MNNRKRFLITAGVTRHLADTITPVNMYLRLREQFPDTLLLESADYRGRENSFSYICCNPIAVFKVEQGKIFMKLPDGVVEERAIPAREVVLDALRDFITLFKVEQDNNYSVANGLFGYITYDAVQYFEDIHLKQPSDPARDIPDLCYGIYEHVLAVNHFKNELYVLHNRLAGGDTEPLIKSLQQLSFPPMALEPFALLQEEYSNFTDEEYLDVIKRCKYHIARGDVFQIVPSRRFAQRFKGDEFQVYRALRSINPSPYLFYFDYGKFRIFGSSPEAQLVIKEGEAAIYPIAGTYRRSGDAAADTAGAAALAADPKENAEHVMLVDLARNDLSKHCRDVKVEAFKEVQQYSHVIHLVSKVTGKLHDPLSGIAVLGDTFPAGTLSGAPKYRAMELIDQYERGKRCFYGGAIGFLGFNGDCNHAIMIRSFLSKEGTLFYQAGGGVVADSVPESEVQEAKNKLMALKSAMEAAGEIR